MARDAIEEADAAAQRAAVAAAARPQRAGCPFLSSLGHGTAQMRLDWLAHRKDIPEGDHASVPVGTDADPDQPQRLYFWQLFSVLGAERIKAISVDFYTRVLADETDGSLSPGFISVAGPKSSLARHSEKQFDFLIDSFGGGEQYAGGDGIIHYFHETTGRPVMNACGAARWMKHMGDTLAAMDFSSIDERIKPCVIDFFRMQMRKYARAVGVRGYRAWPFQESDFAFAAADPEMVRLWRRGQHANAFSPEDAEHLKAAEV